MNDWLKTIGGVIVTLAICFILAWMITGIIFGMRGWF